MCVRVCICARACVPLCVWGGGVRVCVCVCVCVYICVCVCVKEQRGKRRERKNVHRAPCSVALGERSQCM